METLISISGSSKNRGIKIAVLLAVGFVFAGIPLGRAQDEITLQVNYVGGGSSLDFGRLRNLQTDGSPAAESSTRRVRLVVEPVQGNTRPYVVTQILDQEPTNEAGKATSPRSIVYRVEEETGSGTVKVTSETPLAAGEQEIYQSHPQGGNSQLLITYDLVTSPDQEAGSYAGSVTYRVSTL